MSWLLIFGLNTQCGANNVDAENFQLIVHVLLFYPCLTVSSISILAVKSLILLNTVLISPLLFNAHFLAIKKYSHVGMILRISRKCSKNNVLFNGLLNLTNF